MSLHDYHKFNSSRAPRENLRDYCKFNAGDHLKPGPFEHAGIEGDTVEFPDLQVTEEPATDDTMRRFYAAEERKALELIP